MSQFGGSSYPESQLSEPLPSRSKFEAEESAMEIVERILDRAIYRIIKTEKFRENLKRFSNMKTINNINEVNNLNFYDSQMYFSSLPASKEPRPLYVDSLLPISADLDKENTYKLNLKKMITSQVSDISRVRRQSPSKKEKQQKYLKLDIEARDQEEDGFTKQLRKMQEDRENKERNQQKIKEQIAKQQREKLKEKKKQKEEKFSFDYSGLPIKIRTQNKANLISKLINGSMNSKTQLNKEAFNDPNPQVVDSVVLGKKKNSAAALKKKDEVQFQQNRSLSEGVTVGAGVKYTYDGKTLELKKKSISTIELKKTINERRLNKQEYQRLRSLNGSSLELGLQTDFRETKHKRSQSEAKLKKMNKNQLQKEKIIVNNEKLKEKMLEKVNEMMMETQREEEDPERKYEYVGQIDIFNMNYLKNGHGQPKTDKKLQSLSTQRSLRVLPKIGKTNIGKQYFPKERQRIKQINTIIYEIRKKFDQKLKY